MSNINDPVSRTCLAATGVVVAATGVAASAKACVVARTGAGVYTVTLDAANGVPAGATAVNFELQCMTLARHAAVVITAANLLTVTTQDAAGAAADSDFTLAVFRLN